MCCTGRCLGLSAVVIVAISPGLACKRAPSRTRETRAATSSVFADAAVESDVLRALFVGARCSSPDAPRALWCDLATGWRSGEAGDLASHAAIMGLRLRLDEGGDGERAVTHGVRVAATVIRRDGAGFRASIADIVPEDGEEGAEIDALLGPLQATLAGVASRAAVGPRLFRFVMSDAAASHPMWPDAHGWRIDGARPTEVRRVGATWMVIEQRAAKPWSYVLSVMTDRLDGEVHSERGAL